MHRRDNGVRGGRPEVADAADLVVGERQGLSREHLHAAEEHVAVEHPPAPERRGSG